MQTNSTTAYFEVCSGFHIQPKKTVFQNQVDEITIQCRCQRQKQTAGKTRAKAQRERRARMIEFVTN